MKEEIVINKKIALKNGLYFSDLIFLLNFSYYKKVDYNKLLDRLELNKSIINEDGIISITESGLLLLNSVLVESDVSRESNLAIEILVRGLMNKFPINIKPGTSKYWRGNSDLVTKKIKEFLKNHNGFSHERILLATQRYVDSFYNETTLMRTLPNFIEKDGDSDLLTVLENMR